MPAYSLLAKATFGRHEPAGDLLLPALTFGRHSNSPAGAAAAACALLVALLVLPRVSGKLTAAPRASATLEVAPRTDGAIVAASRVAGTLAVGPRATARLLICGVDVMDAGYLKLDADNTVTAAELTDEDGNPLGAATLTAELRDPDTDALLIPAEAMALVAGTANTYRAVFDATAITGPVFSLGQRVRVVAVGAEGAIDARFEACVPVRAA